MSEVFCGYRVVNVRMSSAFGEELTHELNVVILIHQVYLTRE